MSRHLTSSDRINHQNYIIKHWQSGVIKLLNYHQSFITKILKSMYVHSSVLQCIFKGLVKSPLCILKVERKQPLNLAYIIDRPYVGSCVGHKTMRQVPSARTGVLRSVFPSPPSRKGSKMARSPQSCMVVKQTRFLVIGLHNSSQILSLNIFITKKESSRESTSI